MNDEAEILLVEDDPNDLELVLRSFKRYKITNHVKALRDGAEAIEYLFNAENPRPRVILLDIKLPKVSGIKVLERLKADPNKSSIPVVMLTSSAEEPDIKECYRLGVNSYIVKPVDFDAFAKAVAELGMYWTLRNQTPS